MNTSFRYLRRRFTAVVIGMLLSLPLSLHAAPNDAVLLWGEQEQGQTMMGVRGFGGSGVNNMTPQQACGLARFFLDANLPMSPSEFDGMVVQLAGSLGGLEGAMAAAGALRDLDACVNDPGPGGPAGFYLIFTSCSMIMGSGTQWMRWTVPPFSEEASMVALDAATNEVVTAPLETKLGEVSDVGLAGETLTYSVSGPKADKTVTLSVPQLREFDAERFDFKYSGNIEVIPGGMASQFMPKINLSADGHAWIVPDAPGADVIATFYSNFRDYVAPAAGMGSLFSAMVRQMADIATKGIPVETTHTSRVGGGIMTAGLGAGGTSTSTIKSLMVAEGVASGRCARTQIPEGMEVTDVNDMMAEARSGSGQSPGASETSDQERAEAMAEMQEAMNQMSPEEQKMLQQMGIGTPPQAAPAAPATAGAGRSSAELTTNNLTQTVQLHLEELGYEVGETNGELSLHTTIAISQFQAEKGMEVTGEISPQLAGVLAAEVDSRHGN